jgi:integrating conjugative element relaxase (TIGR03760 family)
MFHQSKKSSSPKLKKPITELTRMESIEDILSSSKNKLLLSKVETAFSWDKARYETHCFSLIKRLLMYCENLPESTNNYFGGRGGLFEFALQRAEAALTLFSGYLIVDEDTQLSETQRCWEYALFSAALLYGIGKLYLDYQIELFDPQGGFIKTWNPMVDKLMQQAPYYALKIDRVTDQTFRSRLNALLAKNIMPEIGFDWLSSQPEIFEAWLGLLNEDLQGVKVLGAILSRADALALAKAIEQWLEKQKSVKPRAFLTFDQPSVDASTDLGQQAGLQFIHWLKQQLESGELVLNDGMVTLAKGALSLNADLFKLFLKDFPTFKSWQAVQKGFSALGFHDASVNTADILFSKFGMVLPSKAKFLNAGSKSKSWVGGTELTNFSLQGAHAVAGKTTEETMVMPKLNQAGEWRVVEQKTLLKPGRGM